MRKQLTFQDYGPDSRSWATVVTQTGVTASVLGSGHIKGGAKKVHPSMAHRLISGELLVSTPHQAGGSFSERRIGGIYPTVKAKARWQTLHQQLINDPRQPVEGDGEVVWQAILSAYGVSEEG